MSHDCVDELEEELAKREHRDLTPTERWAARTFYRHMSSLEDSIGRMSQSVNRMEETLYREDGILERQKLTLERVKWTKYILTTIGAILVFIIGVITGVVTLLEKFGGQ